MKSDCRTRKQMNKKMAFLREKIAKLEKSEEEHRRIVGKLKESEEHYRILFESTNDIIKCVAHDGKFIFGNQAWHKSLGYSKEELKCLNLFDIVDKNDYKYCKEKFI